MIKTNFDRKADPKTKEEGIIIDRLSPKKEDSIHSNKNSPQVHF